MTRATGRSAPYVVVVEIELRHLRLVRAVADARSLTKAAAALGASQPSVTRSLRRIEDALGGPLFQRSRHGVEPTALGKLVVSRARAVLPSVESLQDDIDASRAAAGHAPVAARVGASTGPALVGLIKGMAAALPSTQVVIESATHTGGLLDLTSAGRVDLAVVNEYVGFEAAPPAPVDRRALLTQPVFVMLAVDHPLANRPQVDLADLAEDRWVLRPLDVDHEYDALAAACDRVGFSPRVEHYLAGGPAIELVRSVGFVSLCYPSARFPDVVTRPLVDTPMTVRHSAISHPRSPLGPVIPRLGRQIVEEFAAAGSTVPHYRAWLQDHGPLPPNGRT
jgi:DNA-binding transcriptional LysR family regulator